MPERREASLVPETSDQRPRVEQWGTLEGGAEDARITQAGNFRITQAGNSRVTQAGDS
jgi:hypothetical protein